MRGKSARPATTAGRRNTNTMMEERLLAGNCLNSWTARSSRSPAQGLGAMNALTGVTLALTSQRCSDQRACAGALSVATASAPRCERFAMRCPIPALCVSRTFDREFHGVRSEDLTCQGTRSAHNLFRVRTTSPDETSAGESNVARSGSESATKSTSSMLARAHRNVSTRRMGRLHGALHQILHRRTELARALSDYLH